LNRNTDSSLLVKPPVIAIWLALCILAILFGKTALGVFLGFVFVLTLASWLWGRASLKDTEFALSVDCQGLFPGQTFIVTRVIRNRKWLPMLWAEIRETCEPGGPAAPTRDVIVKTETIHRPDPVPITGAAVDPLTEAAGSSASGAAEDFRAGAAARAATPEIVTTYERVYALSLIRRRRSVSFKDAWQAERRGILEIDASRLRSGDGFGLCADGKLFAFPSPKRIAVYPKLIPVSVAQILNDMWDTRSETDGYLKDRTIIKSVRDHQPGDAARDVNMRLFARGQGLMTNVFETVTPGTVLFVLDSGSFKGGDPEIFEHALSVTASLIDKLTRRGIRTSLMAPASKWFSETCTPPSSGDADCYRMFELLAAASSEDGAFTADAPLPADEPGRVYIVCADTARLTAQPGFWAFPEHKVWYLTAGEGAGDGVLRVQYLFDFERAA